MRARLVALTLLSGFLSPAYAQSTEEEAGDISQEQVLDKPVAQYAVDDRIEEESDESSSEEDEPAPRVKQPQAAGARVKSGVKPSGSGVQTQAAAKAAAGGAPAEPQATAANSAVVKPVSSDVSDDSEAEETSPAKPTTGNSSGQTPAPGTAKPVTAKPTTRNPTAQPQAAAPVSTKPSTGNPSAQPQAAAPVTAKPAANNPTAQPQAAAQVTAKPAANNPTAQPQAAAPVTTKPATSNPTAQPQAAAANNSAIQPQAAVAKPATNNLTTQPQPAAPAKPTGNEISQQPQAATAKPASPVPLTPAQNQNTQTITNPTTTQQKATDTIPKRTIKPSDVNLTQPQSQAIQAIRKASNMEQEKRLTDELKQLKTEMNAAMIDATPADEVRKKFELVQRKTLELQKQKFERTLKIRDVLSVEQRKKLNELKSTH